jgi:hypothetical protein
MPIPGSTSTALELIKGALRNINVLSSGEEPSSEEGQDSLVILNQMIDGYNGDGLMIFTTEIDDFPLTSNKQIYTLGSGGDFNIPRPAFLDRASIVILSNPAQPLEYPIPIYTTQDWQEKVPVKNVPGNLPLLIYDDGGFPLRTLTFWPVAADNVKFRLYSWQKLIQFTTLQQSAAYPEGYLEAFRYNLAVRLAPEFGASVSPETALLAVSTLARIKSNNADDTQLRSDLSGSSTPSRMRSELFNIP